MLEPEIEYDYLFKIIFIGDPDVGKTAILNRYVSGIYRPNMTSTIGIDLMVKRLFLETTGQSVKLMLWDTAGQERFRAITTSSYRGVHGIFYVYDITSRQSFENIQGWMRELDNYLTPNVIRILIGNKCDDETNREVEFDEAMDFADKHRMYFIEVSARDSTDIERAFFVMIRKLVEQYPAKTNNLSIHSTVSLTSVIEPKPVKRKRKYC